eukprot:scaffold8831_cov135-Isochrysis_galbana.AAC.3
MQTGPPTQQRQEPCRCSPEQSLPKAPQYSCAAAPARSTSAAVARRHHCGKCWHRARQADRARAGERGLTPGAPAWPDAEAGLTSEA